MIKKGLIVSFVLLGACSTPKMEVRYSCDSARKQGEVVNIRDWNKPSFTEHQIDGMFYERRELSDNISDKLKSFNCNIYPLQDRITECTDESLNENVVYNLLRYSCDGIDCNLSQSKGYREYFKKSVEHCSWKIYLENFNKQCGVK